MQTRGIRGATTLQNNTTEETKTATVELLSNIIKDNNISGIVDFSDLYYCDELMTFYFHSIHSEISSSFLKGYGKPSLTESELTRTIIYRVWTLMKMIIEKEYKVSNEYLDEYEWLYKKFYREIGRLKKRKELVKK